MDPLDVVSEVRHPRRPHLSQAGEEEEDDQSTNKQKGIRQARQCLAAVRKKFRRLNSGVSASTGVSGGDSQVDQDANAGMEGAASTTDGGVPAPAGELAAEQRGRPHSSADANLQVAAAFLPGRIPERQIKTVASHLARAIGLVSENAGMVQRPVRLITEQLGDPRLFFEGLRFTVY